MCSGSGGDRRSCTSFVSPAVEAAIEAAIEAAPVDRSLKAQESESSGEEECSSFDV